MQIPQQLAFSYLKPRGIMSQYKQWQVDPLTSNQYWNPNDIVRFLLQLTEGAMDPYRSYFQIDVQINPTITVGCLQVDNSAQSFISQLVISSKNKQIERITQYDTLAATLTDMGFSQVVLQARDLQGLGIGKNVVAMTGNLSRGQTQITGFRAGVGRVTQVGSQNFSPTKQFFQRPIVQTHLTSTNTVFNQPASWLCGSSSHISTCNVLRQNLTSAQSVTALINTGIGNVISNVRAQYCLSMLQTKYPDAPSSLMKTGYSLTTNSSYSNPNSNPYAILYNNAFAYLKQDSTASQGYPSIPALLGYQNPYSQLTGKGCNQPTLSNYVPTCQMQNGGLLKSKVPVQTKRFLVPVISSVIGVLLPYAQLIPVQSLRDLLIQITLNPYAMFSSGYQDRNQFDVNGMQMQIPRGFRINRFTYQLQLYSFPQQQIKDYIANSLIKGINISSTGWMLGSQYQIPTGQNVRSSYQVNSTCQILAQVVVRFLSNQYASYAFCRKQFALSNNITSYQLKFNTAYYPPQPIIGNGGNPQWLDATGDNSQYYMWLLKSNNTLFSTNTPCCRINRVNFAINGRCYSVANQNPMYDVAMLNNPQAYVWGSNSVNADTAMGAPYFHQNRYVGRAIYTYSFQAFGHSKNAMIGIDSRKARPFQIILANSPFNPFPTDQTMYIFLRHHLVITYSQSGINVFGR